MFFFFYRYATYNDHSTVSAHFALGESAVELYHKQQQQQQQIAPVSSEPHQSVPSQPQHPPVPPPQQVQLIHPLPHPENDHFNQLSLSPSMPPSNQPNEDILGQLVSPTPVTDHSSETHAEHPTDINPGVSKLVESTQNLVTNQDVLDINQFVIEHSTTPIDLTQSKPSHSHFQSPIVVNEFYPHYNLTDAPSTEVGNELAPAAHQPVDIDFVQIVNGKYVTAEPKANIAENCSEQPQFGDRLLPIPTLPTPSTTMLSPPTDADTPTEPTVTETAKPTGSDDVSLPATLDVYRPVEIDISALPPTKPSPIDGNAKSHPIVTTSYVENILETLQHDKAPSVTPSRIELTKLHLVHPYNKPYFLYENDHDKPRLLAKNHLNYQQQQQHHHQLSYPIHFHPRPVLTLPASYYRHQHHHILPKPVYGVPSSHHHYILMATGQQASPKSYHHPATIYADDYVGPPPLQHRHYWPSSSYSTFSDRSAAAAINDCEPSATNKISRKTSKNLLKHIRLEYGFKPPLIPSLEIDEYGNTIAR